MATRQLLSFDLRNLWPVKYGASGTLVITLKTSVLSEDGVEYPATANAGGPLNTLGFHWESVITVASSLASCAAISGLINTDVAIPGHIATYDIWVYDSKGKKREKLNSKPFHLHESLNANAATFTWEQWVDAMEFTQFRGSTTFVADQATVQAYINSIVYAKANVSPAYGLTALSVAPVSAADPIAVGDNDPRLGSLNSSGNLISATSIIIGADSDANGSGTISLQTRGVERLNITNIGNFNIITKLGFNTPVPLSQVHVSATYPIDTTGGFYPIRLTPPTGDGDFLFLLSTTMFGAQNDDVVWWGWNIDGGKAGEPSIHFAMEREFGANPDYEVHLESQRPHGANVIRHWTWNINKVTGETTHAIRADSFGITNALGAAEVNARLTVNISEVLMTIPLRTQGMINFESPAGNDWFRFRGLPADSTTGWLLFGSTDTAGGVPSISRNGASGIFVYSGGSDLSNGLVTGRGFDARGPTGTTVKIALTNDLWIANGQSLLFSATGTAVDFSQDVQITRTGVATLGLSNPQTGSTATLQGTFNALTGSGESYKAQGIKVVGAQGAAVADATDAASVILRLNELLARIRAHGLIAT